MNFSVEKKDERKWNGDFHSVFVRKEAKRKKFMTSSHIQGELVGKYSSF